MEDIILQALTAVTSNDNRIRSSAEKLLLDNFEINADLTITALLSILANGSIAVNIRFSSGVLVRRALEMHAASGKVTAACTAELKRISLFTLIQEENPIILKRLSHIISQLAALAPWDSLVAEVIGIGSAHPNKAIIVCELIEIIANFVPDCLICNEYQHIYAVGSYLGPLMGSAVPGVQVACAKATAAVIACIDDDSVRSRFKPALQPMIGALGECLKRGDEDDAVEILENFVTLAQIQPLFFKGNFDEVINALVIVSSSQALDVSTRSIALEVLITLCETAPALARRSAFLLQNIVKLCMSFMVLVDTEEAEWLAGKYGDDPLEGSYSIGEEALQRACAGLGLRALAQSVFAAVEEAYASPVWSHRRAAIAAVARLSEGTSQAFIGKYFDISLQFLVRCLSDSCQAVTFEAVQTIGIFALAYTEKLQDIMSASLSVLIHILSNVSFSERLRGHSASALINMFNPEFTQESLLQPHLNAVLQCLSITFQNAPIAVLSPCLVLLGSVAQVAGESFAPFYPSFMPGIKSILATALSVDLKLARFKAMECAGVICEAVGAQVCAADATELMTYFIGAIEVDKDNEFIFEYALPACVRLAKAFGAQAEQMLPLIMGPLLTGANVSTQYTLEDADEEEEVGQITYDEDNGTESTVIATGSGSKKRITLSTHALDQKKQAARLLHDLAETFKGRLHSYLVPILTTLLGMVTDKHSSDVRSTSSLALAKVFVAVMEAFENNSVSADQLHEIMAACLGKSLEALKQEVNSTSQSCEAECLKEILHVCYMSGTADEQGYRGNYACCPSIEISSGLMLELLSLVRENIERYNAITSEFAKNEGKEEEDKEGIEEMLEELEDLLRNLIDSVGELIKLHKDTIMPTFDAHVAQMLVAILNGGTDEVIQATAICLLDDVIEFGGSSGKIYVSTAIPVLLRNFGSTHTVLRQASVYGVMQCVRVHPDACVSGLPLILSALLSILHSPHAKEDEYEGTVENAAIALGFICCNPLFRSTSWGVADTNLVISAWLAAFPFKADVMELRTTCQHLCDRVERGDTTILGSGHCNLVPILKIFATVLIDVEELEVKNASSLNLVKRIQGIARQIITNGDFALTQLSADQQRILQLC